MQPYGCCQHKGEAVPGGFAEEGMWGITRASLLTSSFVTAVLAGGSMAVLVQ